VSHSGNPCLAWVLGKAAISAYKANLSGRALRRGAIVTVGRFITERRKRNHVRQLEALRYKVTLPPAA
jgi:primosomal replication protein N